MSTFGKILWQQTMQALTGTAELGFAAVQFAGIMHCIREYLFDITLCSGPSMLPSLGVQGNVGKHILCPPILHSPTILLHASPCFQQLAENFNLVCACPFWRRCA